MKHNEDTKEGLEDSNADYRFLRENGLHANIALRMLSIAYMVKERLKEGGV